MKLITDQEYDLFQKLKTIFLHAKPEHTGLYFICGEMGEHNEHGLPESVLICPMYGLDWFVVYSRNDGGEIGSTVEET